MTRRHSARQQSVDAVFEAAKTIADGIGAMFGENCEVAVHDLRRPANSLVHLVNGHLSGRELGHPIGDFISSVLPNLGKQNILANYPTRLPDGRVVKSTSCLLRDADGEPVAALCINYDVSGARRLAGELESFLRMVDLDGGRGGGGDGGVAQEPSLGEAEVLDVLRVLVRNTARQFGRDPRALTKEERLQAIEFLENKGAFLIKGSVPMVAEALGVSEPSVYRYIDLVRKGRP
jgi:predicted transcriptional regulator YheO